MFTIPVNIAALVSLQSTKVDFAATGPPGAHSFAGRPAPWHASPRIAYTAGHHRARRSL